MNLKILCLAGISGLMWPVVSPLSSTHATGTWTAMNSGTTLRLGSIDCAGKVCIAAGDSAMLVRTTNAGESWEARQPVIQYLNWNVAFADSLNVYAAGGARLHRSTNAGADWSPIEIPNNNESVSAYLHFVMRDPAAQKAYATAVFFYSSGGTSGVYAQGRRTERRGAGQGYQWFGPVQGFGVGTFPTALEFASPALGYMALGHGGVVRTVDSGTTWTVVRDSGVRFIALHFPQAAVGYAAAEDGQVYKTHDSGKTWSVKPTGATGVLRDVHFNSVLEGYAVGDGGTMIRTLDGGTTWESVSLPTSRTLYAVTFRDRGATGYAVGEGGTLLRLTGGTPAALARPASVPARVPARSPPGMRLVLPDGRVFDLRGKSLF